MSYRGNRFDLFEVSDWRRLGALSLGPAPGAIRPVHEAAKDRSTASIRSVGYRRVANVQRWPSLSNTE